MSREQLLEHDERARERAQSEFAIPLVLEAGAGTGKTATLVARVLAWTLGPGWERSRGPAAQSDSEVAARVLERIAAITFTEAAAAEMAERIAGGLAQVGLGELPVGALDAALPVPAVRAVRARALLGQIDRLVVRTIHSYCRRLLASFPLEAGLHPGFEVDPEGTRLRQIGRELLESKLRQAYADPGQPDFLRLAEQGCGPGEIEALLVAAVTSGLPASALEADPFPAEQVAALLAALRDALAELRRCESGRLAEVGGRASVTAACDEALFELAAELERCAATRAGLDALAHWLRERFDRRVRARLRAWARGTLTAGERKALAAAADEFPAHAQALLERVDQLRALEPERLEAARRVVAPLLAELESELRRAGVASFDSLLRDARELVLGNARVRARIQRDTDQLLVDEFQDTDAIQCDLVRALALEGPADQRPGLFIVGDPKQSIYGWRRADLAAYQRFVDDVVERGGELWHLHRNFRSRPAIIDEVQQLIGPVMAPVPGLQPGYQELVAQRPEAPGRSAVEHWVSWLPDEPSGAHRRPRSAEAAELEARAVAQDMRRLHDEGVAWTDMAMLMRSRGELETYLAALRDSGVPFDVLGDRSYYQRREVIDAGALVRCIVDPNDQLSLVTWLRSPSVGVPDAALLPLWSRDFPGRVTRLRGEQSPLLDELRAVALEVAASLPDVPGLERIAGWEHSLVAALEALAALRDSFEADPADTFVEALRTRTWIEASEASRYLGRYRVANLERFLRRLTEDLYATAGDASAILRALRQRVREAEDEEEARPKDASDDAVQVRTIHQAKGLDWDHVYLVQTHKNLPGFDDNRVCGTLDGRWEYRLLDAPTLGFEAVQARFRAVAQAEQVRTLYVALTRARERLVICGSWPERPPPEPDRARSHVELLQQRQGGVPDLPARYREQAQSHGQRGGPPLWHFPALALDAQKSEKVGHPLAARLASRAQVERDARTLAALRPAAEQRMSRPFRAGATSEAPEAHRARREGSGAGDRSFAAAVGSAIHQILEHFDPAAEAAAENERQRRELPHRLETLLEPDQLDTALVRGRELLARLQEGPLLERLRALGPDVARELPVLAPAAGEAGPVGCMAGVIDLLYRDPDDGGWVVADYKTDRARDENEIAGLLERYAPQGAVYARAVQDALGLPDPPRFELWLVDAGRVVPVPPVHWPAP